ncbi:hypothetical protein [Microvirga brassicacearum]|uniref:Uncharacterized protein n=1 Tax=Microvirga brassicacearum TaxID=2580413 RepID=A0A5N3PGM6_9HYPH|nr:hypothetical protein [Microvirga brassicacearum]KAB0268892.1 hypothetical protein FEZ63_01885 [Microvirga brassicacearum]
MPQTLSQSDIRRRGSREPGFAPLGAGGPAQRPTLSIVSQILSRIFPGRSADRAVSGVQPMIAASPDLFPFYLERGIAFFELGHYHKALADFRTALRLNWRDEEATIWIGRAEAARERLTKKSRFHFFAHSS